MINEYLIDLALASFAYLSLIFLKSDIKKLLLELKNGMNHQLFAMIFEKEFRRSGYFTLPFAVVYLFCLWRFYDVLVFLKMYGYGAMGLLLMTAVLGIFLIWLRVLLLLMFNSQYLQSKAEKHDKR